MIMFFILPDSAIGLCHSLLCFSHGFGHPSDHGWQGCALGDDCYISVNTSDLFSWQVYLITSSNRLGLSLGKGTYFCFATHHICDSIWPVMLGNGFITLTGKQGQGANPRSRASMWEAKGKLNLKSVTPKSGTLYQDDSIYLSLTVKTVFSKELPRRTDKSSYA